MSTTILYNMDGLDSWARAQDAAFRGADFTPALRQCAVAIRGDALLNFQNSSGPEGQAWPPLKMRSGKPLLDRGILQAAVTGKGPDSVEEITTHSLEVGCNLIQARIQQEGGTIRPKNAKKLTIPLTKAARKSGGARKMAGLFVRGKALAMRKGKGVENQFALVDSVTIPARPFLGFGPRLQQTIDDILADFLDKWEAR